MPAFALSGAALLRRNRLLLTVALAPLVIGLLALVWGVSSIETTAEVTRAVALTVGLISTLVGFVASIYVIRADPFKVKIHGDLAADDEGVRFAGRMIAPRRSLRAGFLIPTWGKPPLVRIDRRWPRRPLSIELRDEPAGRALLRALGFDASQVVASFTFASRARADPRIAALGWTMLVLTFIGFPMIAAATADSPGPWLVVSALVGVAILIGWTVLMSMPTRAIVGADGVLVSWFWRKRFIRYSDVRAVRPFGAGRTQGVALWTSDAAPIKLPIKPQLTQQQNDHSTDLVTQRIQQAIASYHEARREREVALPERGQRSIATFIQALRAAGSGASADHRTAPVSREELFRIAEDPGAEPTARASAAIAIGGGLDETGRTRLRIAAESTASPDVRALLELSAEEADDERIASAFQRLAAPSPRPRG